MSSFYIKRLKNSTCFLQWNLYSEDTLESKSSVPWREAPPERKLGLSLLIINQQIKYFYSALESAAVIIWSI